MTQLTSTPYRSPVGTLTLVASESGLRAVIWPGESAGRVGLTGMTPASGETPGLSAAATQLDEYFAGTRTTFDLPLDLRGTEFQLAAWEALAEIPYGETRTYAEQAARLGRPAAVRAVGTANGRNPLSIVLPCHRVVGSDGALRGFAGGLDVKAALLVLEREHAWGAQGDTLRRLVRRNLGGWLRPAAYGTQPAPCYPLSARSR